MTHAVYADFAASITELKKNPMGTVSAGEGRAVAILNRNEPAFYCVPADEYAAMLEIIEDWELGRIVEERKDGPFVAVSLDDL